MIQVTVKTNNVKYCFQISSGDDLYSEWSALMTDDVGISESYADTDGTTSTWTVYKPAAVACNVWHCGDKVALTKEEINSIVIVSPYPD